jgi:DNA-binding transcriptional LysR family regulator
LDRIDLFRIFTRVVDCASFTRAADTLGIPRSSVSAAVQELEGRVGARLLNRTTRKVSPTEDGSAFYERCQRLIADVEDTENLFRQTAAQPSGRLRIDVPAGSAGWSLHRRCRNFSTFIRRSTSALALPTALSIWWRTISIVCCASVRLAIPASLRGRLASCG